jgi:hypothetical protein
MKASMQPWACSTINAHVDQLGGVLAHDVDAEQPAVARVEDELHLAGEVAHDLAPRVAAILRPPHAVRAPFSRAALLGLADHRHLRDAVDGEGSTRETSVL